MPALLVHGVAEPSTMLDPMRAPLRRGAALTAAR